MSNVGMQRKTIDQAIAMYEAIKEYFEQHERPPVIRDLQMMQQMSSTCTVRHYLNILRDWGWIDKATRKSRTIRLTRPTERIVVREKPKAKSHVA